MLPDKTKIAIIGLGYVGLPLAVEFGKHFPTLGFDINTSRLDELKQGIDRTLEVSQDELTSAKYLNISSSANELHTCNVFIVTVPTPINKHKAPDLSAIKKASVIVGSVLDVGNIVIYESTVYPGATEEFCVPILERESNLKFNKDFYAGYSPERINPGDKKHRLPTIKKVVFRLNPRSSRLHRSALPKNYRRRHTQD